MKKYLRCFWAVLILIFMESVTVLAAKSDYAEKGMDVVIVLDGSGSMTRNDPERVAIEAAKMYVDLMENGSSRVAIVPFTHELGDVTELKDANTLEQKEVLKAKLDKLVYNKDGDTDIGLALKKSCDILKKESDKNRNQLILFFTDGQIDLPKSEIRTKEASLKDTASSITNASDMGVKIYTIGLNVNGEVDTELIKGMADQTLGRSYVVTDAAGLPDIFNEIFADFINSITIEVGTIQTDGKNFSDLKFNISNDNVVEANVIMLSTKKVHEIELLDNKSKEVKIGGEKASFSQSDKYGILKIYSPEKGDWILRVKGEEGCSIHVNMIFNYKLELKAEVKSEKGKAVIEAYFENEGQKVEDEGLYKQFKTVAKVKNNKKEETYDLTLNSTSFNGEIPIPEVGDTEILVLAESDSLYREYEPIVIDGTKAVDGKAAKQNDKDASKKTENKSSILPVALGVVVLLLLAALIGVAITMIKKKNHRNFGDVLWSMIDNDNFGAGSRTQNYNLGYEKGDVRLSKIVTDMSAQTMGLEKIYVGTNPKTNNSLLITNNSQCDMCPGYGGAPVKKAELQENEFVLITKHGDLEDITLKITFTSQEAM